MMDVENLQLAVSVEAEMQYHLVFTELSRLFGFGSIDTELATFLVTLAFKVKDCMLLIAWLDEEFGPLDAEIDAWEVKKPEAVYSERDPPEAPEDQKRHSSAADTLVQRKGRKSVPTRGNAAGAMEDSLKQSWPPPRPDNHDDKHVHPVGVLPEHSLSNTPKLWVQAGSTGPAVALPDELPSHPHMSQQQGRLTADGRHAETSSGHPSSSDVHPRPGPYLLRKPGGHDPPSEGPAGPQRPVEPLKEFPLDLALESMPDMKCVDEQLLPGASSGILATEGPERQLQVGRQGELVVYKWLLLQFPPGQDTGTIIEWVNEKAESGLPYDMKIINTSTSPLKISYVEVKTTSALNTQTPFEISLPELQFAGKLGPAYSVFRVVGLTGKAGAKPLLIQIWDPVQQIQSGNLSLLCAMAGGDSDTKT